MQSVGPYSYRRGAFVAHLNLFGEKGNLATRRAVPAKVCHSMVRSTLRTDTILPNDVPQTNRETIGRRYPLVFFVSVGLAPMAFWVWMVESTLPAGDYVVVSFGFGQVRF